METEKLKYEDFKINVKLKLSALWASVMFLYVYGDYFELYVPGKTEGLLNGQNILNSPYRLAGAAFVLALPSMMIFISLILKPLWNRVLNISIAVFLTLFTLLVGFSSFTEWRMFYVMLSFLESGVTTYIAWKAWRWPAI